MSNDLMKHAEMRQQRRPRSTQNEEIILLDKHVIKPPNVMHAAPVNMDSLPPIRLHCNHDNSNNSLNKVGQLKPEEQPRTPRSSRRITISHNNSDLLGVAGDVPTKKVGLPFINCKVNNKDVKALISTSAQSSTINRRVRDMCNISKTPVVVSLTIDDNMYKMQLTVDDVGVHDLVIGMDFISDNNCVLDFGRKSLSIHGSTTVPFVNEDEVPLKFRTKTCITASM